MKSSIKLKTFIVLAGLFALYGCKTTPTVNSYKSENLKIEQLSAHTYVHISYLNTQSFGKVACNGLIVIDDGEALIFDTPVDDTASEELLDWTEGTLKCKVKGVIVTHFHMDCLGGLNAFHQREIPSYAINLTIQLAKTGDRTVPQNGFDNYLELPVGKKRVVNEFLGEGHTKDNIIAYFPAEKVLFGGCLVKQKGAGKGNLEDANTVDWPKTIERVKTKYSQAQIIVPGHGKQGGQDLLDYTVALFKNKKQ